MSQVFEILMYKRLETVIKMANSNDRRRMSVNIDDVDMLPGIAGYHLRNFDDRTYVDSRGTRTSSLDAERSVKYNFHGVSKLIDFIEYGSVREKALEEVKNKLKTGQKLSLEDLRPQLRAWQYDMFSKSKPVSSGNATQLIKEDDFSNVSESEIDRTTAHRKNLAKLF